VQSKEVLRVANVFRSSSLQCSPGVLGLKRVSGWCPHDCATVDESATHPRVGSTTDILKFRIVEFILMIEYRRPWTFPTAT
jgi:hypothetical protein